MTTETPTLEALIAACIRHAASDLHLSPGQPPFLRIHGELQPLEGVAELSPEDVERMAGALAAERGLAKVAEKGSVDGALSGPDGARFRFNVFCRQGRLAVALRRLEERIRALGELGLPESLYDLCSQRDGLVVVSGPTGSGKSTTLAALLDRINGTRRYHIVTIEDPIEYLHRPARCLVNQRQVGTDAPSFHDALVSALRQDPDVILVGEVRDLATIRTAIAAAETGHLVFTTLHAGDCVSSVERLVSVFPAEEQDAIRRQLSLVLRAVLSQHLLPAAATSGAEGRGRVVACEILRVTPAVANLIATGRGAQIASAMEAGQSAGMLTLEQNLAHLLMAGRISEGTALTMARNASVLRDRVEMLRRGETDGGPRPARVPAAVRGAAR